MADNLFNNQNILVESDYENITVIDPNRVFNKDGTITERLVNHEELVMYANLEAVVIPRTKLVNGSNFGDSVQNIRIGSLQGDEERKINFLRGRITDKNIVQQEKDFFSNDNFFDTNYTDDLTERTGKDSNDIDTQLLGITNIDIKISTALVPQVQIEMVDVQGRVLFEQGEKSPYSAFMQQPYPLFILTVKGYYGKAIRYELMLEKFNAKFDPSTGNYVVTTNYIARTFALLNDISLGYLYSLPKMYHKKVEIGPANPKNQQITSASGGITTRDIQIKDTTRGKDILRNVYTYYRNKGLIGDDFPDQQSNPMTLEILIKKLEYFNQYVIETYGKEDMSVLVNIRQYRELVQKYRNEIFGGGSGNWFSKYIDGNNPLILKGVSQTKIYPFKKELPFSGKTSSLNELRSNVDKYNSELLSDSVFGENGKYIINGIDYPSSIPVNIKYSDLITSLPNINSIDFEKTYQLYNNRVPTEEELTGFTKTIKDTYTIDSYIVDLDTLTVSEEQIDSIFFKFGDVFDSSILSSNSFLKKISLIEQSLETKRKEIEEQLTNSLLEKVKTNDIGLGFNPTINNVMAVICANADAFLRLMDEIHEEAWNKRKSKIRLQAILGENKNEGIDSKDDLKENSSNNFNNSENFTYPWPSYFEAEIDEYGNEKLIDKYPGDPSVINLTKGYRYDEWPEIQFVEEFITATFEKKEPSIDFNYENGYAQSKNVNFNPIEFPFFNPPYNQLDDLSFYYEIIERSFLFSNYTKFNFDTTYKTTLLEFFSDVVVNNIKDAVKNSPDLSKKLKDYAFTYDNILNVLEESTNPGKWSLFERDEFVNSYIKNLVDNNFGIYKESFIDTESISVESDIESTNNLKSFFNSEESGKKTFLDTYPFTNLSYIKDNLSNGINTNLIKAYKVNKTISFLDSKKTISSFSDYDNSYYDKKVFTYFEWTLGNSKNPIYETPGLYSPPDFNTINYATAYFNSKTTQNTYLTESVIDYGSNYNPTKNNLTSKQTTSFINTPYFINAIIEGVDNEKNGIETPYISLGYLYLNSLPLNTLSEKLKTFKDSVTEDLDYVFATLNNYSAIHRLPYEWILKIGSVYHRYKKYKKENIDILDGVWKDFDYVNAYDPVTNNISKNYTIQNYENENVDIKLKNIENGIIPGSATTYESITLENGFYPKIINDIYYLFTGKDVLTNYDENEINNLYHLNLKTGYSTKNLNYLPPGYDVNNPNDTLTIKNWFSFFKIENNADFTEDEQGKILILPSYGWTKFNQSKLEIIKDGKLTTPYVDNNAIYNGSVRTLWSSTNYGYFNNDWIKKPNQNEYIKTIKNDSSIQDAFNLKSEGDYHSIEEIFSVFTKDMLDVFENHFLNFCKTEKSFNPNIVNRGQTTFDDFLKSPEVKNQYPNGVIPYEDIFKLKTQFKNQKSAFNYGVENNRYVSLKEILKPLFFIEDVILTGSVDEDIDNIRKSQIDNFVKQNSEYFLNTNIILKIGNAGKYNRKVFDSFSNLPEFNPIDKINFGNYVQNSLPTIGGVTTLSQSISNYPQEWETLFLYVGEYRDEFMEYKDTGSYITDFFVDLDIEFTTQNIIDLSQIIKVYASQKRETPTITKNVFYERFNEFLINTKNLQNTITNQVFVKLNQQLPTINIEYDTGSRSTIDGNITKLELWKDFQYLNDRWVSGQDFKNRTLFEEFLFLDEANRPVGDNIIIDIEKLRQKLIGKLDDISLYGLIGDILTDNGFLFMPTPVYANYYGLNDRVRNGKPTEDSSGKIAKDMFGTYMEVDVRETRPKLIGIYISQVSQNLDFRNNKNIRRLDDATDLTNPSNNSMIENLNNKEDYSNSNKVVGFNVEFGNQEQGIFKSISLDMSQFKDTAEVFKVYVDMGNYASGQRVAQQTVSLYNIYKNRSYTCNVTSIGNVMIQPTTYFILKHVPMFNGPYFIMSVNHKITPQDFTTTFEGVRISKYSLARPDKLVTSVNRKFLKTFENKILQATPTEIIDSDETTTSVDLERTEAPENNCADVTAYNSVPFVALEWTSISSEDVINYIESLSIDLSFKQFIYSVANIEQPFRSGISNVPNNNLFGILSQSTWPRTFDSQITGQTCIFISRENKYYSYVAFDDFNQSINFFKERLKTLFPGYYNDLRNYSKGFDINNMNFSEERKTAETLYRLWRANWTTAVGFGKNTLELNIFFDDLINSSSAEKTKYYKGVESFLNSLNQVSGKFT